MASRRSRNRPGEPISTRGRLLMTACLMVIAIVLGFAASTALYQKNRESFGQSNVLGYLLCGSGQHIDDVPTEKGDARRMICRDAAGTEVSARNNWIALILALPFIIIFAIPGLMMAWMMDWRQASD